MYMQPQDIFFRCDYCSASTRTSTLSLAQAEGDVREAGWRFMVDESIVCPQCQKKVIEPQPSYTAAALEAMDDLHAAWLALPHSAPEPLQRAYRKAIVAAQTVLLQLEEQRRQQADRARGMTT